LEEHITSINRDDGGDMFHQNVFLEEPNGIKLQNTAFSIVSAMRSSNLIPFTGVSETFMG
jgi:hypothetical protein